MLWRSITSRIPKGVMNSSKSFTTFYTTLDSEALPLSEIDVAITDDDTATPALKGILSLICVRLASLTPPSCFQVASSEGHCGGSGDFARPQ